MPLQATSGAASQDAFGGNGVPVVPNYIEDVFSTYLWTGTGANRTITNGIDLSTKGGMVWIKSRNFADNHNLFDTTRGATNRLFSNLTAAQSAAATSLTAFTSSGFSLGSNGAVNGDEFLYASWTFREQAKFFDIQTFTGNGSTQAINHNLGSAPGMVIVKAISLADEQWMVWHRSLPTQYGYLNLTSAWQTSGASQYFGNNTTTVSPTSTQFTVGLNSSVNQSAITYVAYLFAHDAGGFGLTGTDNVISCGSFTSTGTSVGADVVVNLGYEVQYVLAKANNVSNWQVYDTMRGLSVTGTRLLYPNDSSAEVDGGSSFAIEPNATGFTAKRGLGWASGTQVLYIAIRRGPMKVPTTGTSVFNTNLETNGTNPNTLTTDFPVDLNINTVFSSSSDRQVLDRLRGFSTTTATRLQTNTAVIEATQSGGFSFASNTGVIDLGWQNQAGGTFWSFRRAPSFFDEVCYSGNSTAGATQSHNLGVVPELMLIKSRTVEVNWNVYSSALSNTEYLSLNTTDAKATGTNRWNSTSPTASVFTLGTNATVNGSGEKYVAYLFATCPNVSKVGSYTGNGTTQTINCGFTGGARFVLIKRTDATGDWYVYDTARGMTTLTDPYLLLNTSAAQTATLGSVTTVSTGFALNAAILAAINTNAASYIFLAIS
jgi:hypothetical protein